MQTRYSTVYPLHPQTPVTPIAERQAEDSSSSTAATPRARARASAREALDKLEAYYCRAFGRRACPPSVERQIVDALRAGMYARTICQCIDAAQAAERPSWAYAYAVITRCIAEGALTPEDFEARAARHQQQRQRQGSDNPALQYDQRTYTEEQLMSFVTDPHRLRL